MAWLPQEHSASFHGCSRVHNGPRSLLSRPALSSRPRGTAADSKEGCRSSTDSPGSSSSMATAASRLHSDLRPSQRAPSSTATGATAPCQPSRPYFVDKLWSPPPQLCLSTALPSQPAQSPTPSEPFMGVGQLKHTIRRKHLHKSLASGSTSGLNF